jgi:ribose 1,5-bisphosphokinase
MSAAPGSHRLIYTMGPSGAGKDSLLAWLKDRLPEQVSTASMHWARRTITRAVQPEGEQHESVDLAVFQALSREGAFGIEWQANGLHYGVRHGELAGLRAGRWVIVNGSRAHLAQVVRQHPALIVLHITAGAETLRRRLMARGRESAAAVEARLQRTADFELPAGIASIEIRNDGSLDEAGAQLLQALMQRISAALS